MLPIERLMNRPTDKLSQYRIGKEKRLTNKLPKSIKATDETTPYIQTPHIETY